jgi:hypothetical protein
MIFAVQSLDAASTAVAEGLHAPIRVTRLTGDTALVAEGGLEANAGRLTVLSHASGGWTARPLLTGLPSGFDAGDQAFFGPTDVEPQGNVLFVLIGIGDSRLGEPGTHASPILSSVLEVVFSRSAAPSRLRAPTTISWRQEARCCCARAASRRGCGCSPMSPT